MQTPVILSWTTHPASVSGLNSRTDVVFRIPPQLSRTDVWLVLYKCNSGRTIRTLPHTHLLDNKIKQCKHSTWSGTWTQGCEKERNNPEKEEERESPRSFQQGTFTLYLLYFASSGTSKIIFGIIQWSKLWSSIIKKTFNPQCDLNPGLYNIRFMNTICHHRWIPHRWR